mgnify:CR=1 FL=1
MPTKITNIADITKFTDGNGNTVTDRDSQENNVNLPTGKDLENYRDSEINRGEAVSYTHLTLPTILRV